MFVVLLLLSSSCAHVPYLPSQPQDDPHTAQIRPGETQIERGRPNGFLDFVGKYQPFSLFAKLLLWNWKVENHDISPETEAVLRQYLQENNLQYVKIRINQYAPGGEWSRLSRNKSVAWGWRWTFGMLNVVFYTILPGRVFGGDAYNPYTNSIYLYSDHPAIAVHEGGHAKSFSQYDWKGTNAFLYGLPLVALYYEAKATGDAVGYFRQRPCLLLEKNSYKVLYPAYFTYIGGETVNMLSYWTPVNELWALAAVVPGHILGRIKAALVDTDETEENICLANPPSWAQQAESIDINGECSIEQLSLCPAAD